VPPPLRLYDPRVRVRPQDIVAAGYDAMADRFAAWAAATVGDPRERYVGRLLQLLPDRPEILELGCGAGVEPTPTLADRGNLTAVDISRAQLDLARHAVPGARFVEQDLTRVRFEPASFDAVVSLYVLTHVPSSELPDLIERIGTWLRPDGVLLATLGGGSSHDSVVDDWLGVPMFFAGYEPETNERLVREAGLTILESRLESMEEPESEPGGGVETALFHWLLAQKR
jgi:SAM-dependent methyltransferase